MGSTRLPGKSLLPFGRSTLLQHVLRRLRRMTRPVDLLVATSTDLEDDEIAGVCAAEGAGVFRGSCEDVLGRVADAVGSLSVQPELILRVCADRPFVCPQLADELLDAYDDAGRPDYFSNTLEKSYPDGLDLELVRAEVLLQAAALAVDPYEREHVTPYVYRRPERFSLVNLACPYGNYSHIRATIDTEADYEALRRVDELLGGDSDWRDLLTLAAVEPELFP